MNECLKTGKNETASNLGTNCNDTSIDNVTQLSNLGSLNNYGTKASSSIYGDKSKKRYSVGVSKMK